MAALLDRTARIKANAQAKLTELSEVRESEWPESEPSESGFSGVGESSGPPAERALDESGLRGEGVNGAPACRLGRGSRWRSCARSKLM